MYSIFLWIFELFAQESPSLNKINILLSYKVTIYPKILTDPHIFLESPPMFTQNRWNLNTRSETKRSIYIFRKNILDIKNPCTSVSEYRRVPRYFNSAKKVCSEIELGTSLFLFECLLKDCERENISFRINKTKHDCILGYGRLYLNENLEQQARGICQALIICFHFY